MRFLSVLGSLQTKDVTSGHIVTLKQHSEPRGHAASSDTSLDRNFLENTWNFQEILSMLSPALQNISSFFFLGSLFSINLNVSDIKISASSSRVNFRKPTQ